MMHHRIGVARVGYIDEQLALELVFQLLDRVLAEVYPQTGLVHDPDEVVDPEARSRGRFGHLLRRRWHPSLLGHQPIFVERSF